MFYYNWRHLERVREYLTPSDDSDKNLRPISFVIPISEAWPILQDGQSSELSALHDQLPRHQTGDTEIRVGPSKHLRHLRPDRAGARPPLGAADTRACCLHRR